MCSCLTQAQESRGAQSVGEQDRGRAAPVLRAVVTITHTVTGKEWWVTQNEMALCRGRDSKQTLWHLCFLGVTFSALARVSLWPRQDLTSPCSFWDPWVPPAASTSIIIK